jgi:hypothetical protein
MKKQGSGRESRSTVGGTGWRRLVTLFISALALVALVIAAWGFWDALRQDPFKAKDVTGLSPGAQKAASSHVSSGYPYPLVADIRLSRLNDVSSLQTNIQLHIEDKTQFDNIKSDKDEAPWESKSNAKLKIEPPLVPSDHPINTSFAARQL